ncbi:SDR family NAD(P)-dependent oxidoreductase [Humibacter ginsenosidimutans]|uniref:SDR family NAD(P)-dependent oxidoreductase n=1 Tax=Humibacter ginsenosidimutans TaxID=2599293 RepID=A0A5B8M676_9MICO|nr:SDR family NAD(P)-dependent oxidoreductase [Humibacter ginsenosidimutans]QDZ15484.1 SDR family NAD(P)-dependent oxidoreductase [Humibacter ginsenosidimutans]
MTTTNIVGELAGKVALVTGATSGIGRATALKLAEDGAEVLVHGRDAARGARVVQEIGDAGGRARFIAADLGDSAGAIDLAAQAGEVDILVNNAGFSWFGPSEQLDAATLRSLFASNVEAAYLLTAQLAPSMVARGTGSIINVSSMAASIGLAGGAAYSATKAALSSFTKAWAAEYSPKGVRVNAVAPGPIYTGGSSPDRIAALGETTLLGAAAQPEDIADTIAFLASPRAAYITGAVVAVDGGRTAI